MAKREHKVTLPEFGKYLTRLRENRKLKQAQVIYKSKKLKGAAKITSSNISRYEAGKTADPSLAILRTFSIIYKEPLENITLALMNEKYGVTLNKEKAAKINLNVEDPQGDFIFQEKEFTDKILKLNTRGITVLATVLDGLLAQKKLLSK